MEPAESVVESWWLLIPALILLYFSYVLWTHVRSKPHQVAYISFLLGLAGLLFCPLGPVAIYCSRKARRLSSELDSSASWMAHIGNVLGIVATIFLGLVLLMASIYLYAWVTGQ